MTDHRRWRVRKWPGPVGRGAPITTIWDVFDPDGMFSGSFDTWGEAMEWATSFAAHVEHWLQAQ